MLVTSGSAHPYRASGLVHRRKGARPTPPINATTHWLKRGVSLTAVLPQQQPFRHDPEPKVDLVLLPDEEAEDYALYRVEPGPARYRNLYVKIDDSLNHRIPDEQLAGARMAPGAARAAIGSGASAAISASGLAAGAKSAYEAGAAASSGGPLRAAGAGVANVARTGASAVGQKLAESAKAVKDKVSGFVADAAAPAAASAESAATTPSSPTATTEPAWAQRMRRRQQMGHAATTAAHTLRGGDGGGSGSGPSLRDSDS